jgi:hypothetical protein
VKEARATARLSALAALAVFAGACGENPRPARASNEIPRLWPSVVRPETTSEPRVRNSDNNWGNGPACIPKGETLSLEGTIVVRPFGKGADGALLKTSTEEWIVSYRADGVLRELQGRQVRARGRACDKQGEAVVGKHFDLTTVTETHR